jgi:diketogulonate reductase-like aldo/keto reductase
VEIVSFLGKKSSRFLPEIFKTHHVYNGEDRLLQTLEDLQLKQLDLLLMHWPHVWLCREKSAQASGQKSETQSQVTKIVEEYLETWKRMERLKEEGLVKYIGVSNLNREQIDKVLLAGLSKLPTFAGPVLARPIPPDPNVLHSNLVL